MHGGTFKNLSDGVSDIVRHFVSVGHWHWDFVDGTHFWSPGLYPILGIPDGLVRPDYALLF